MWRPKKAQKMNSFITNLAVVFSYWRKDSYAHCFIWFASKNETIGCEWVIKSPIMAEWCMLERKCWNGWKTFYIIFEYIKHFWSVKWRDKLCACGNVGTYENVMRSVLLTDSIHLKSSILQITFYFIETAREVRKISKKNICIFLPENKICSIVAVTEVVVAKTKTINFLAGAIC